MGIFKKIKDMFTEEYEDEPVKTEVKQVIIPAPVEPKEEIDEVKLEIKKEEKPEKPVFFGDDEFEGLTRSKTYEKKEPMRDYKVKKEEKKVFKPTPVISPVYGVLDKNYSKEDITTKSSNYEIKSTEDLTIDLVRKKAYGTLEEELETTLTGIKKEDILPKNDLFEDLEKEPDIFDELEEASLEKLTDLDKFERELLDEIEEDKEEKKKEVTDNYLFDLIDSMYEKRDE